MRHEAEEQEGDEEFADYHDFHDVACGRGGENKLGLESSIEQYL